MNMRTTMCTAFWINVAVLQSAKPLKVTGDVFSIMFTEFPSFQITRPAQFVTGFDGVNRLQTKMYVFSCNFSTTYYGFN